MTTSYLSRLGTSPEESIKAPCVVSAPGNITLSGEQTIAGVAVTAGQRVLVRSQTDPTENGIYDCLTSAWTRSSDFNDATDVVNGILVPDANTANDVIYKAEFVGDYNPGVTSITFAETVSSGLITYTGVSGVQSEYNGRGQYDVNYMDDLIGVDLTSLSIGKTILCNAINVGSPGTYSVWEKESDGATAPDVATGLNTDGYWYSALSSATKFRRVRQTQVTSIAKLKLAKGDFDGQQIQLQSYYGDGAGGGGPWYWKASSTETADDGMIVQVTGVTTGRWKRPDTGYINSKWYGIKHDGATDNAARLLLAKAYCSSNTAKLQFDGGTVLYSSQIDMSGIILDGVGESHTILYCDTQLGAGIPSIILASKDANVAETVAKFIQFKGPGSYSLGVKTAICDGVRIDNKAKLENCRVRFYDSGIILNSATGHITLDHVQSGNNYFGVYFLQNNFDHYFVDCQIDGNAWANVACPYNGSITFTGIRNHMGHAPYGIWQEDGGASTATNFLIDVNLFNNHFEAIGNSAIRTPNAVDGTTEANSAFIRIYEPGFSWSTVSYRIGTEPFDYAVHLGYCTGHITIEESHYPFTDGTLGAIHIAHQFSNVRFHLSSGSGSVAGSSQKITIGGGNGNMINPVKGRPLTGTILNTQTSVTISTGYYGPAAGAIPLILFTQNPNGDWWLSNLVNDGTTNEVKFNVNLSAAATGDTPFSWMFR